MKSVTNAARGGRVVNVRAGKDAEGKPVIEQVMLAPGETRDLDILDEADPVFAGLVAAKEIVVGPKGSKPETDAEKADRLATEAASREDAAREEGYKAGYAKGLEDAKKPTGKP